MSDYQFGIKITADGKAAVDSIKDVESSIRNAGNAADSAAANLGHMEMSSKAYANSMRMVPAQVTDIVTGLMSGQAPMTVLIQQGGQLKDMFGGVGPAVRAIGTYVVGLVNPISVAAAGAGALAYAFSQGASEARDMAKTITVSGNAAATSINQMQGVAESVAQATNATKGFVTDALNQIVATGKVSSSNLSMVADATTRWERSTGKAISDTVKEFEELGKSPVAASLKLNDSYNYLTTSVYKQIKALEEQGKTSEAASLAQRTYAESLNERSKKINEDLGTLATAWRGVSDIAKQAWDMMLGVGREGSLEDRLAKAKAALANGGSIFGGESEARAQIAVLEAQIAAQKQAQQKKEQENKQNKAGIDFDQAADKYKTNDQKQSEEIEKLRNLGAAAGKSEKEIQSLIAQVTRGDYMQSLDAQLAKVRESMTNRIGMIQDAVKLQTKSELAGIEETKAARLKAAQDEISILSKKYAASGDAGDRQRISAEIEKARADASRALSEAKVSLKELEDKHQQALGRFTAMATENLTPLEQAWQKFWNANSKDIKEAQLEGWTDVIDKMQAAWKTVADQTNFDDAKARFEAMTADMQQQIEAVRQTAQKDGGFLAGMASEEQVQAIRNRTIPMLNELIQKMDEFKGTSAINEKTVTDAVRSAQKAANEVNPVLQRFFDDIRRSLTDDIYRGLEQGGKSGALVARDSIVKTLKAIPIKLAVEAVISSVTSQVSGLFGFSSSSTAGSGGTGSLLNLASGANSLYNGSSTVAGLYNDFAYSQAGQAIGLSTASGMAAYGALGSGISAGATGAGIAGGLGGGLSAAAAEGVSGMAAVGGLGSGITAGAGSAAAATTAGMTIASALPYVGLALGAASILSSVFGGEKGAPKTDIRGVFDATASGYTLSQGTGHSVSAGGGESLAASVYTDVVKGIVAKYAPDATYSGYIGSQINTKGSSSNQDWAYISRIGEVGIHTPTGTQGVIYNNHNPDMGKGTADYQAWVQQEVPRLQLAIVTDALRSAGGEVAKIANSVMGTATDLTTTLDAMSGDQATATIASLQGLVAVYDQIRTTINPKVTADAVTALAQVAGGVSNLSSSVSAYYANFYSDSERQAAAYDQVAKQFSAINVAMPSTRAGFRNLVEGLDLTKEADQRTFASLMSLSGAFAQVVTDSSTATKSVTDWASAAKDAESNLRSAYDAYASALTSTISKFDGFAKSLATFRQSLLLGNLSPLDPLGKYTAAKSQYEDVARRAQLGDTSAIEQLQSVSDSFLQASRDYYASSEQYGRDFADVQGVLGSVQSLAERQTAIAQEQLDTLRRQVGALIDIKDSVDNVAANMAGLASAVQSAAATTKIAQAAAASPTTAAIVNAYQANLGRLPDDAGLAYWQGQAAAGASTSSIASSIAASPEATVNGLYESLLGRGAESSGSSYWQAQLAAGASVSDVTAGIMASSEYKNSHAGGLEVVPYDGYKATLHHKEAVVDASSVAAIRRYFGVQVSQGNQGGDVAGLLQELIVELRALVHQNGAIGSGTLERLDVVANKIDDQSRVIRRAA